MKKRIRSTIKITIGILLLAYLLWQVDAKAMWHEMKSGNLAWLVAAIFCITVLLLFLAPLKLWPLLRSKDEVRFWDLYKASLIGLFFNNILPSSVGGDAVKVAILKKNSKAGWAELVAASLTDRFIGLGLLFAAGVIYLILNPQNEVINMLREVNTTRNALFLLIPLTGVIPVFLFFRKRLIYFFIDILRSIRKYNRGSLLIALGWALVFQSVRILALLFYLRFYNFSLALDDLLFVLALVTIISTIPLSMGALGVRENALAWGLALYGVPFSIGAGLALLSRFVFVIISLSGALFYFKDIYRKKKIIP